MCLIGIHGQLQIKQKHMAIAIYHLGHQNIQESAEIQVTFFPLQVCDAEKRIIALDPTFPGSVHDAFVWKASSLHEEFVGGRNVRPGEYLLGKSIHSSSLWSLCFVHIFLLQG